MSDEKINIELVYALPAEQTLLKFEVPKATTIAEAIRLSGILEKHPEIDLEKGKFGVFGKLSKTDTVLREKDRMQGLGRIEAVPLAGLVGAVHPEGVERARLDARDVHVPHLIGPYWIWIGEQRTV